MQTNEINEVPHMLETSQNEREYWAMLAAKNSGLARAAYRRAVEVCTGGLPTWAQRKLPGRPRTQRKEAQ